MRCRGLTAPKCYKCSGKIRGGKAYVKTWFEPFAPFVVLNVLSKFSTLLSLSLRLFGNIFGEETVTEQLYEILPIGAPIIMMVLSLLFCAIQAVVFTMLTSIYLEEAVEEEK